MSQNTSIQTKREDPLSIFLSTLIAEKQVESALFVDDNSRAHGHTALHSSFTRISPTPSSSGNLSKHQFDSRWHDSLESIEQEQQQKQHEAAVLVSPRSITSIPVIVPTKCKSPKPKLPTRQESLEQTIHHQQKYQPKEHSTNTALSRHQECIETLSRNSNQSHYRVNPYSITQEERNGNDDNNPNDQQGRPLISQKMRATVKTTTKVIPIFCDDSSDENEDDDKDDDDDSILCYEYMAGDEDRYLGRVQPVPVWESYFRNLLASKAKLGPLAGEREELFNFLSATDQQEPITPFKQTFSYITLQQSKS